MTTLQKKNSQLQEDLDEARETAESLSQPKKGGRGGPTTKQLQVTVSSLRAEVAELEEVNVYIIGFKLNILILSNNRNESVTERGSLRYTL